MDILVKTGKFPSDCLLFSLLNWKASSLAGSDTHFVFYEGKSVEPCFLAISPTAFQF